jgi:hypothetical protein
MATLNPKMFKHSNASDIWKLVKKHFLPHRSVLQWCPKKREIVLTPNAQEIVVLKPYIERGFMMPCNNFILQIAISVHI